MWWKAGGLTLVLNTLHNLPYITLKGKVATDVCMITGPWIIFFFCSLLTQSFKCWWPPEGQKHYKDVFHLIFGNCFKMYLLQRPRSSFFQPQETEAQKIGGALTLVIPFNLCFLTLNSRTLSNALAWNITGFNCAELTESLLETEGAHMVSCESSPKSLWEHCLPAAFNEQIKPMCK